MAGVAIKKGVRVAIGWYIQYITQQISTFGSGVAQALRSISNDVEEIKRTQYNDHLISLLNSLNLSIAEKKIIDVVKDVSKNKKTVVISDAIESKLSKELNNSDHLLMVGTSLDLISVIDPLIDSRTTDINTYLTNVESSTLDLIVLQGSIEFLPAAVKLNIIENSLRSLTDEGALVLAIRSETRALSEDEIIAQELNNQQKWSPQTWSHVLKDKFVHLETKSVDGAVIFIANLNTQ